MTYLFLDTETTGLFDFKGDVTAEYQPRIVQLGAILADASGKVLREHGVIVKPEDWVIPDEAAAIHGITTEHANKFGIPMLQALTMLEEMAALASTLVAHNISYDMAMVNREALSRGIETKTRELPRFCTMKETTDLVRIPSPRGYKWPKLIELHQFLFQCDFEGAHSALGDCRATMRCFFRLKELNSQEVAA